MNSILSDLYHGELYLNQQDYPEDSRTGILLESFREDEEWLSEMLNGKAKEHLLKLVNIYVEFIGAMTYDSFREGFALGARLHAKGTRRKAPRARRHLPRTQSQRGDDAHAASVARTLVP